MVWMSLDVSDVRSQELGKRRLVSVCLVFVL